MLEVAARAAERAEPAEQQGLGLAAAEAGRERHPVAVERLGLVEPLHAGEGAAEVGERVRLALLVADLSEDREGLARVPLVRLRLVLRRVQEAEAREQEALARAILQLPRELDAVLQEHGRARDLAELREEARELDRRGEDEALIAVGLPEREGRARQLQGRVVVAQPNEHLRQQALNPAAVRSRRVGRRVLGLGAEPRGGWSQRDQRAAKLVARPLRSAPSAGPRRLAREL